MEASPGRSETGAPRLGVLGGGVDSTAGELVLEGEERVGFDREEW